MDFSRFIINTTAGVAGIFDWASKIDLPKHDEDFGQTLGFWGYHPALIWYCHYLVPVRPEMPSGCLVMPLWIL